MSVLKKENSMRTILYKKRHSLKDRRKMMSICETSDEQDCKTSVRKHFVYLVTTENQVEPKLEPPRIDITKCVNTKTREERFHFRVKGYFFMARDNNLFRVRFCHSLHISITWKPGKFSPQKSATLTE